MEPINEIYEEAINHTVSCRQKKVRGHRIAAAHKEVTNFVSSIQGVRVRVISFTLGPDSYQSNSPVTPYITNKAQHPKSFDYVAKR